MICPLFRYRDFTGTPAIGTSTYINDGLIKDRHGKRLTIIALQLPVLSWHKVIAEKTIAEVI